MKIIHYFILFLILVNLFFIVGCSSLEKSGIRGEKPGESSQLENNTGISDVFEENEEVSPPQTPPTG